MTTESDDKTTPSSRSFLIAITILTTGITIPLVVFVITTLTKPTTTYLNQAQNYTTDTSATSIFTHGLAYFKVEQTDPQVHAVKKLSVFHKMITETCFKAGKTIIGITPCGPGVMIEGEIAYSAMLVTYAN